MTTDRTPQPRNDIYERVTSQIIAAIDAEVRSRTLGQRATTLCVSTETGPEKGLIGAAIHVSETPVP